jgi:hypothetical protein
MTGLTPDALTANEVLEDAFDASIEATVNSHKMQKLVEAAKAEFKAGNCREVPTDNNDTRTP